ncbi:adenosylcobinamide-GDP ribazoletransferase [Cumulibacter manganitolerans]|uniref:adenosylcobinamide-GDP ribazoletransferase n=1 Tax=Cumulibacter manganitolerans TaxID=1884992 RepID=UPI0012955EFC|nr:adenosylcobinamide-GDP ribazoletransferase [Cumulibacter manganitolerans]
MPHAGSVAAGLRLAVGTLTVVPVGEIRPLPAGAGRVAMLLAPVGALPVGVAAAAVLWLATLIGVPPLVGAALCVAAVAASTRAMHLDGLADTVDGFGGGWTRERALEIMRSGDVGPMGVAAMVLSLLVQAGSVAALATVPWAPLLVGVAVCVSRYAATVLCLRSVPAARGSGLGAVVAASVPLPAALAGGVVWGGVLSAAAAAAGLPWWWGAAGVLAMIAATGCLVAMARRQIGGITGDVLGAGIEIALSVALVVLTVAA